MNMDRQADAARVLAWAMMAAIAIAGGLEVWVAIHDGRAGENGGAIMVLALGALGLVGTMIVRRARNQVGWIFVVLGGSATITGLSGALVSLDSLYEIPWTEWWMWWNDTGFIVATLALPPLAEVPRCPFARGTNRSDGAIRASAGPT